MRLIKSRHRWILLTFVLASMLLSACTPSAIKPIPIAPSSTPYYSAPRDESMDTACRITINSFFSYKKGDDPKEYRNLFTSTAQFRADGFVPPVHSRIILDLMPASEEWLRDFPGTPMPGTIFPEKPNEYIYYVKFTGIDDDQTNANTNYFPADFIAMILVADGPNSCKIANLGQG